MEGVFMIAVLVRTDGRDSLLAQTIESLDANLVGPITRKIIHTDAGPGHVKELADRFLEWEIIGGPRLGFGGAINRAWRYIAQEPTELFLFDTEDDFIFKRPVPLIDMASVLSQHPHIAQLALRRQPWNGEEKAAGGIVEMWPDSYTDVFWEGCAWLEHRLFWTTNPSLFHISRCASGWPAVDKSEAVYSKLVFADPQTRGAYWGSRDSGEWVTHIGDERVGKGY